MFTDHEIIIAGINDISQDIDELINNLEMRINMLKEESKKIIGNNNIIHSINSISNFKHNELSKFKSSIQDIMQNTCDHDWEIDYVDTMNPFKEGVKIEYCSECGLHKSKLDKCE